MDCKSSRHVSEQLSSPTCSAHPSGRGSPRRTWACRLHCAQRMVTSGAGSVMAALRFVSRDQYRIGQRGHPARLPSMLGYHTIETLKLRLPLVPKATVATVQATFPKGHVNHILTASKSHFKMRENMGLH